MHHGRSARICPWPYAFSLFISPIAHILSSYGLLQHQYPNDTQLYVAISKDNYDNPVAKLELCLSTLHTWFCHNWLALNPDKCEAIMFDTICAHVVFELPLLSMSPEPLYRFPIRSGFLALPLTVDSHLMHTSLHCLYHIRALRHIRLNLTLYCSKKIACLSTAVTSITRIRPSWGSRLRTFLGDNVCKARLLVLSYVNGDASASPNFAGASLASYQVAHRL